MHVSGVMDLAFQPCTSAALNREGQIKSKGLCNWDGIDEHLWVSYRSILTNTTVAYIVDTLDKTPGVSCKTGS